MHNSKYTSGPKKMAKFKMGQGFFYLVECHLLVRDLDALLERDGEVVCARVHRLHGNSEYTKKRSNGGVTDGVRSICINISMDIVTVRIVMKGLCMTQQVRKVLTESCLLFSQ